MESPTLETAAPLAADPRPDLVGRTREELTAFAVEHGMRPFRGQQLTEWLHRHAVVDFAAMTNIARADRERLARIARIGRLRPVREERSADGTRKFLFALEDGRTVETVLIPDEERRTLCISTQVGCAMGCRFCLTAQQGLERHLTSGEIVGQLLEVQRLTGERVTNAVFMGMGEPLHNFEAVVRAVQVLTDDRGVGLSARRLTVSTCGLVPRIRELTERREVRFALAVSLNATTDAQREEVMPVNRRYPIRELVAAIAHYARVRRDMGFVEYVLLGGFNDTPEDARRLARLLRPVRCKINLIPYNAVEGAPYAAPTEEAVETFRRILLDAGYSVFTRKPRGRDIRAACGQLRQAQAAPSTQP
ncbi:MAG: 23S rRNA (adenine(2503)-C(2))-methyltransferase RlmN [Nitrospirae bacterium]|nr:MAG: 23S rRNA (adenine(2503)-C(2))-methyltransferase RlmN [Nitrospirota bacterium]